MKQKQMQLTKAERDAYAKLANAAAELAKAQAAAKVKNKEREAANA